MIASLKKSAPERDRVVILSSNGEADIAAVYDRDDTAIYASSPSQEYTIPQGDLKAYVGSGGRIYVIAADPDYVSDTTRLAALEQSIVLRAITHYTKPPIDLKSGVNIQKILLYSLIAVLLLAVIFK